MCKFLLHLPIIFLKKTMKNLNKKARALLLLVVVSWLVLIPSVSIDLESLALWRTMGGEDLLNMSFNFASHYPLIGVMVLYVILVFIEKED